MFRILQISLVAACSLAACSAYADIYVYIAPAAETGDEIRLSNLPVSAGYKTLVRDETCAGDTARICAAIVEKTVQAAHRLPYDAEVQVAARAYALEPALIHAVIATESGYNRYALSPRGAYGLMQLMPATQRRFGLVSDDPAQNIQAGARYLRELHDKFNGDLTLMLAAFNAGPNAVLRNGRQIPPFAETRHYVPKVMRLYRKLSLDTIQSY